MSETPLSELPSGVRAIAVLFALCAIYLAIAGGVMLISPGTISMSIGAPLLFGLELAGPYMSLLFALLGGGVAWRLLKLDNLARRVAIVTAIIGVVMLVPAVSGATIMVQPKQLAFGGLGIMVRVMVAWYLSRGDIADQFKNPWTR